LWIIIVFPRAFPEFRREVVPSSSVSFFFRRDRSTFFSPLYGCLGPPPLVPMEASFQHFPCDGVERPRTRIVFLPAGSSRHLVCSSHPIQGVSLTSLLLATPGKDFFLLPFGRRPYWLLSALEFPFIVSKWLCLPRASRFRDLSLAQIRCHRLFPAGIFIGLLSLFYSYSFALALDYYYSLVVRCPQLFFTVWFFHQNRDAPHFFFSSSSPRPAGSRPLFGA